MRDYQLEFDRQVAALRRMRDHGQGVVFEGRAYEPATMSRAALHELAGQIASFMLRAGAELERAPSAAVAAEVASPAGDAQAPTTPAPVASVAAAAGESEGACESTG